MQKPAGIGIEVLKEVNITLEDANKIWSRKLEKLNVGKMERNLLKMERIWGHSGGFLGVFPDKQICNKMIKRKKYNSKKKQRNEGFVEETLQEEKKEFKEESEKKQQDESEQDVTEENEYEDYETGDDGEEEENYAEEEENDGEEEDDAEESEEEKSVDDNLLNFYSFWVSSQINKIEEERNEIFLNAKTIFDCEAESAQLVSKISNFEKKFEKILKLKNEIAFTTNQIDASCKQLLRRKVQIQDILKSINQRLHFMKKFNVLQAELHEKNKIPDAESFVKILNEIDESILFFNTHLSYLQSDFYRTEYEKLRLHACQLIRNIFNGVLDNCEKLIKNKPKNKSVNNCSDKIIKLEVKNKKENHGNEINTKKEKEETVNINLNESEIDFSLFYTKFRAYGEKVKPYISLLYQKELSNCHDVYHNTLIQLEGIFAAARIRLLTKPIQNYLHSVLLTHTSLVLACRHITTIILSLSRKEFSVFFSFFPDEYTYNDSLKTILESFGGLYYETLRPAILACDNIDQLREIICILNFDLAERHAKSNKEKTSDISSIFNLIFILLIDVQERLIYCVETFIRNEIDGFKPNDSHLSYPDILLVDDVEELPCEKTNPNLKNVSEKQSQKIQMNYTLISIYLPIQNALFCLNKIYKIISNESFESLAEEIICICIKSLLQAAEIIQQKKDELNANLFLLKHFMFLRENLNLYDCRIILREKMFNLTTFKTRAFNFLDSFFSNSISLSNNNENDDKNNFKNTFDNKNSLNKTKFNFIFKLFDIESNYNEIEGRRCIEMAIKQQCEFFVYNAHATISHPLIRLQLNLVSSLEFDIHSSEDSLCEGLKNLNFEEKNEVSEKIKILQCFQEKELGECISQYNENISIELPKLFELSMLYMQHSNIVNIKKKFKFLKKQNPKASEESTIKQECYKSSVDKEISKNEICSAKLCSNFRFFSSSSMMNIDKFENAFGKSNPLVILFNPLIAHILRLAIEVDYLFRAFLALDEDFLKRIQWKTIEEIKNEIQDSLIYYSNEVQASS